MARDRLVVGDRGTDTAHAVPPPHGPGLRERLWRPAVLDSSHDQRTRDQPTRTGLSTVGQSPAALS